MMLNRRIECEILGAATSRFRVAFCAEPLGCGQLMMVTDDDEWPFCLGPRSCPLGDNETTQINEWQ